MRDYWSNSKLANCIRGRKKPEMAEMTEWARWEFEAKEAFPIRYWLAEELLDSIQSIIHWPFKRINDIRYWLNNRFVVRTHQLTSKLQPGAWHELDERILHCLFDELVNFVEIDSAWMAVCWNDAARVKYRVPVWRRHWWLRWFRQWRNRAAGLDHLAWEMTLTDEKGQPTFQAQRAKEVYELYFWWTTVRPARPDPYQASGWLAHCEKLREKYGPGLPLWGSKTRAEKKESDLARRQLDRMEADYDKEDERMLIKLIKIRKGLWT